MDLLSEQKHPLQRRLPLVLVLLAPIILTFTLPNPINQFGMLDPYIYTGYINDYHQLLDRYGATYYGNRFAFIEIGRLAAWLGPQAGYLISKLFYLLVTVLCVYQIFRRYYGSEIGLYIALWVCFNPWLVRSIFYDYVEAGAVAFAFIGILCLLGPGRQSTWSSLAGGMASAAAFNIHYLVGVAGVAVVPAWIVLNAQHGFRYCIRHLCLLAVGFVAGYLLITAMEDLLHPRLGFFREFRSLQIMWQLLSGGATNWFITLGDYLAGGSIYIVLPLPVIVASGLILVVQDRTPRRLFHLAAFTFLSTLILLYLISYFVFSSGLITHFYGFFYLLPAVVLAFGCSVGEIALRTDVTSRRLILGAGVILLLVLWFGFPALRVALEAIPPWIYAATAVVFVGGAMLSRASALLLAVAMIAAAFAHLVFYHPSSDSASPSQFASLSRPRSQYSGIHDAAWARLEADTYWASIDFLHWIGNLVPTSAGRIGFWYSNDRRYMAFSSVQSVFLWGYSRVHGFDPVGMPSVDDTTRKNIESSRYVVLIGLTPDELEAGLSALRASGIRFQGVNRKQFHGSVLNFEAEIIERLPSPPVIEGTVADVPASLYRPSGSGKIAAVDNGINVTTVDQQWGYSALADLRSLHLPSGKTSIRLRVHVISGTVGLAVNEIGNISKLLNEIEINPTSDPYTVAVPIADGSKAEHLIVRNRSALGPSVVEILAPLQ